MDQARARALRALRDDRYDNYEHPSHQADPVSEPVSSESDALADSVGSVHAAGPHDGTDEYDPYEVDSPPSSSTTTIVGPGDQVGHGGQKTSDSEKTATWKIHWMAPSLILACLLAGVAFALGHHFHYNSLDGTMVSSQPRQEWALRFGSAFAVLTQSCLVASVGAAYAQRFWVTVKGRDMALETLDRVFSLKTNLLSFFSWEVLRGAKLLCLLGLCAWLIPISSTVTPATLSVRTETITNVTEAMVPSPDYSTYSGNYWGIIKGAGLVSGPSPAVGRIVAATMSSISILPLNAPFPNSSYTLNFHGPAFRCQHLKSAVAQAGSDAASLQNAWDLTMDPKLPTGGTSLEPIYTAASPVADVGAEGDTVYRLLFITLNWNGITGSNYSCRLWNTSYTVDFDFDNGIQSTSIQDLQHVAPFRADPNDTYVDPSPGQVQYTAIYDALVASLTTQIEWGAHGKLSGQDSAVITSGLAACPEIRDMLQNLQHLFDERLCRAGDVPAAIEDLSHNVTLSLLSSEFLANETFANVTTRRPATFYTYNWHNLVLAYAIAVFATLVCAAVGVQALLANGYSANASFSTILLTTRNEDLDYVARGHCLGESPMDKSLGRTMLRYGILNSQAADGSKVPHAAFGLSSDVRTLRKGESCQ
ncbi:hypothetical protein VMCG_07704 [Cytospora schulzeri]|uniref:Uncharacterized protein n=1 Tax=Cytospora schulzeri TaxID=448051 RepID=A0A423VYY7_9PEZI|nr:hypothetical protein VMCG_07704 [Valsa malicola]